MKLLFFLSQDISSAAAARRYLPIAIELTKLDYQVEMVALHPQFYELKDRTFSIDGIKITYVGQMHVKKHKNVKEYFSFIALLIVVCKSLIAMLRVGLVKARDTNIIFICKSQPLNGIPAIIIGKLLKKFVILDCDDLESENNRFPNKYIKKFVMATERILYYLSDHITVHSTYLENKIIEKGISPLKISYVPHGVIMAPKIPIDQAENLKQRLGLSGKKVIVYIGSLSSLTHDFDLLLDSIKILAGYINDFCLLIVGRGESYNEIMLKVKELDLEEKIIFIGWIPPNEVGLYYSIADVSVDPVCDNEAGRASLSLKIFDSFLYGIPVISTNVGDRKLIIEAPPAGILVPPNDAQKMAVSLYQLLTDSSLYEKLKNNAKIKLEKYSWSKLVRTFDHIIIDNKKLLK